MTAASCGSTSGRRPRCARSLPKVDRRSFRPHRCGARRRVQPRASSIVADGDSLKRNADDDRAVTGDGERWIGGSDLADDLLADPLPGPSGVVRLDEAESRAYQQMLCVARSDDQLIGTGKSAVGRGRGDVKHGAADRCLFPGAGMPAKPYIGVIRWFRARRACHQRLVLVERARLTRRSAVGGEPPHAPARCTREVVLDRKNGTQEVLHDQAFSFSDQRGYPLGVVVNDGDTFTTTCTYENNTSRANHGLGPAFP